MTEENAGMPVLRDRGIEIVASSAYGIAGPSGSLDLPVPDHSTLSRRAETLEVPRPRCGPGPVHLLVDSTGLRLCGPGEWLAEKHGSRRRRSWR
jgi:hypothetical protein